MRHLLREDVLDWAGERTVQRAEGYLDRVGEIFAFDDFIAAKVRGTEPRNSSPAIAVYIIIVGYIELYALHAGCGLWGGARL